MNYEYEDISTNGIVNVIRSAGFSILGHWDRNRIIAECDMLIDRGDIDEIELILEEGAE